jgi:pimeloyl-ACP methyl ester carboxylesterase
MTAHWFTFRGQDGRGLSAQVMGAGPTLVLLHGGGSDGPGGLLPLARQLRDRFRVVLPELRGVEDLADVPLSRARLIRDIEALLDHLDLRRAAVGGEGLGADLALHMATARPARVRAAVLSLADVPGSAGAGAFDCHLWNGLRRSHMVERSSVLQARETTAPPSERNAEPVPVLIIQTWGRSRADTDGGGLAACSTEVSSPERLPDIGHLAQHTAPLIQRFLTRRLTIHSARPAAMLPARAV